MWNLGENVKCVHAVFVTYTWTNKRAVTELLSGSVWTDFFERRKQEKFVFFVLCHVAIWRGPGLSGSPSGSQQPEVISGSEASGQGKEQASRSSSNSITE